MIAIRKHALTDETKESNMSFSRHFRQRTATVFTIAMALLMGTMAMWGPPASAQTAEPIPPDSLQTITVSGTGIVATTPDTADLSLGIRVTNESLKTAQGDVTRRLTSVMETLAEAGIPEEDIKTSQYSVNPIPEYDRNGNYKGIQSYEVSVNLTVTVRDIDQAGALLDSAVTAGANYVFGISMYVDDTTSAANQARDAAMKDARARADAFAKSEGVLITGVYNITETSAPRPPSQREKSTSYDAPMAMESDAGAPVPVSVGTTDIQVTVSVVYIIEQGNG